MQAAELKLHPRGMDSHYKAGSTGQQLLGSSVGVSDVHAAVMPLLVPLVTSSKLVLASG